MNANYQPILVIGIRPPTLREPMLAPRRIPTPDQMSWPMLASEKIDGVRGLVYPRHGLRSRTGCRWSARVDNRLADLLEASNAAGLVFDGELVIRGQAPWQIQRALSSGDGLAGLEYHVFDAVGMAEFEGLARTPFATRLARGAGVLAGVAGVRVCRQTSIAGWRQMVRLYRVVRRRGGEGLVLRDPCSVYHHGRCTLAQAATFKIKPSPGGGGPLLEE